MNDPESVDGWYPGPVSPPVDRCHYRCGRCFERCPRGLPDQHGRHAGGTHGHEKTGSIDCNPEIPGQPKPF